MPSSVIRGIRQGTEATGACKRGLTPAGHRDDSISGMEPRVSTGRLGEADPAPYVLVTIPRSLEPSVRGALGGLHLPFFVEWAQDGIVLVARAAEWQRVAARFPGAVKGYRLSPWV